MIVASQLRARSSLPVLGAVLLCLSAGCTSVPSRYDSALRSWQRGAPRADAAALPADADLAALLRHAAENNAALRAAHQEWRAALEAVPQAVSLPDPRLTFAYFVEEVETRNGPMDWRLGLHQPFPWFGKLDLAGGIAVRSAEAASEAFVAEGLGVARRVSDAFYEYAYLEEAIRVTREHRELLLSWEEIAQIRYATGSGSDADVTRAQVELGKLDDRVRSLEDLRRPLVARINAELDRPAATPIAAPVASWPRPAPVDEEALHAELRETSPRLRALRWRVEAAELRVELADKEFWPDYSLGAEYTAISSASGAGVQDSGDNALSVAVGIELPIRRRRIRAAVQQASAQVTAARARLADEINRVSAELEMALYGVRDAERRLGLFRDTLIPKGRQSIVSLTAGYEADAAGFLDLVDAERVLLEFELAAARAQADHAQALAEVVHLSGVPLAEGQQP
jgi:outer membrane protein TolC